MDKYHVGDIILGYVSGIENYGLFVIIDDVYNGLIHISEISDHFIRDINKVADIGEQIKVKIVDIDEENHQLKLSIKNLNYRITKKKKSYIKETKNNFLTLENMLYKWIDEKIKEIYEK